MRATAISTLPTAVSTCSNSRFYPLDSRLDSPDNGFKSVRCIIIVHGGSLARVSLIGNNRNEIYDCDSCLGAECRMPKISRSLVLQFVRKVERSLRVPL